MDSLELRIKEAEEKRANGKADSCRTLNTLKLEQLIAIRDYKKATHIQSEAQIIRDLIDYGIQWAKATGIVPPE